MPDTEKQAPGNPERGWADPFKESAHPWLVLARNAIPVAGVYWFGWTVNEVLLQLWFAGVTALAAMLAFQILAFASREDGSYRDVPFASSPFGVPVFWLMALLLLGSPYWFLLLIVVVVSNLTWTGLLVPVSGIALALLAVMISNIAEEAGRGYGRMTNAEIRVEFNWNFSMHLARLCVIFSFACFFWSNVIILPMLLGLSCVEIYPMQALRLFGGHKTLDKENERRSPD